MRSLRNTRKLAFLIGASAVGLIGFASAAAAADDQQTQAPSLSNGDIIVTAQKREERLIDAPLSVSVVSGNDLAKTGSVQFSDWANSVPGISFTTQGAGFSAITLRGVTTGNDIGSTVATYVDDVPFGDSTPGVNSANFTFDPGLFDIERIEVLRGPQGTIYGSSTLGGLIKYVSPTPDAANFKGRARAGVAATQNGGVSYNGSGSLNIPLAPDKAAVRVSGFYSHDGGFIDNIARDEKDVNRANIKGGRIDLLLTPVEDLSIRLSYFLQNIDRDGQATADFSSVTSKPLTKAYEQSRFVREPFAQRFRIASGVINYELGFANLASITSYQTQRSQSNTDASGLFAAYCGFVGAVCARAEVPNRNYVNKFTQEVRLTSTSKGPIEWSIGGYFNKEHGNPFVGITGLDADNQPVIELLRANLPVYFKELAGFGNLTYHITDKLEVTGGIRYTNARQKKGQFPASGPFGPIIPLRSAKENATTYLVNASYHFSRDSMLYARFSTGYRPGGPTVFSSVGPPPPGTPDSFERDQLKSYEVGYKGQFFDRRLAVDLSGYHINWSAIHSIGNVNGFAIVVNSGDAVIDGVEASFTAHPTDDLTFGGALTYSDARLKRPNANLGGTAGDRLPNVPRVNASLSADYTVQASELKPTIGLTARRITARDASFDNNFSYPQYHIPGYTNIDLRAGLKVQSIDLQFYVRNLTNKVQQQSAYAQYSSPGTAQVAVLAPRTFGMSASIDF